MALSGTLHIPDLICFIQSRRQSCFPYFQTSIGYLFCARHCARKYGFVNLQSSLDAHIQLIVSTEEKCTPGKN